MRTITIRVKNDNTLRLLDILESLNLIQVVDKTDSKRKKLSKRLAGSISKDQADKMQDELQKMRSQWVRNI